MQSNNKIKTAFKFIENMIWSTVVPAKSDSDVKFCLQSY